MKAVTPVTAQKPCTSRQRKSNQSLEKYTPEKTQFPFLVDGCETCNSKWKRQQRIKMLYKTLGSIHTHMASLACFWFTTVLRDLDSLLCSAGWLKSSEVSYLKTFLNPPVRTNPPPQLPLPSLYKGQGEQSPKQQMFLATPGTLQAACHQVSSPKQHCTKQA